MTVDLAAHGLGTTEEFGLPGINGNTLAVLAFDKLTKDQSVQILPQTASAVTEWVLGMDVYIPAHGGNYTALLQTGDGDADLFLKRSGDSAGIGTMSSYAGAVPFDEWVRLVVSIHVEDGDTVMRKYVNGTLIGTQNLGETDRWALDPDLGLRLFTDNDGETAPGYVSSIFFTSEPPAAAEVTAMVAAAPSPSADGFFAESPAGGSVEFSFDGGAVETRYGASKLVLQGSDYQNPVQIGDSSIGRASQFGIVLPGRDIPVLHYSAFETGEGLHVNLPEDSANLTSYTLVWDLMLDKIGGYQSLLQIDPANNSDADFFISSSGGIGINGNYRGAVPVGEWARVVLTVEELGNGNSTLSKYIDGVLVGSQTMSTGRFTLDAEKGLLLLADNDGEVGSGYLAHFGMADHALSAAEVAALGKVDADGPFANGAGLGQLGFDGYEIGSEFGLGEVGLVENLPEPPLAELIAIKDMLVTPDSEPVTYDLEAVFGAGAHDFAVTNSNGEAVEATIKDGVLTFSFGEYGLSDLVVTAIGANGEELHDNVRIRVAGEGAYTIAIMPDTQDYTSNSAWAHNFTDMTTWLAENAANKGLGFVTHVGDITQWAAASQFEFAKEAMNILREAGIPFSVLPGNHDIGAGGSSNERVTDTYNDAFSVGYMSEDPTYGGSYDQEPDRYDNNYHLWDAPDGTGWIFLNLEFGPRDDVLRWADEMLTQYGDRKAMITTHSYNSFAGRHDPLGGPLEGEGAGYNYGLGNDPEGSWDGEEIWREVISSHANVVFTAGGHIFGDGAETVVSYNDYGNAVYQFLVNYQNGVALEATQGGGGGNGAIRLVTVDPENDAVYTETYFTEKDTYDVGSRVADEESRDGLTGDYKGHQEEFYNANIGVREALAEADAGQDTVVSAESGATKAKVTLSAEGTTDPKGDIQSYFWTDKDGNVVARGKTADIDLGAGVHDLTLTVTTAEGIVSDDQVRVIVKTDAVHLVETFNDGDAKGWIKADAVLAPNLVFGTDTGFGLPAIGDGETAVMKVNALSPDAAIHVNPDIDGPIQTYTLVYDLYVPGDQGGWTALLQTDVTNGSDGELFIRDNGTSGGLGISSNYQGAISYEAWNRVAITMTVQDGKHVLTKYVNGVKIGTQTVDSNATDGSRWTLDGDKGFLLFADESDETSDLYLSSVAFTPEALSDAQIGALGGVTVSGPLSGGQADGAFQLNFKNGVNSFDFGAAEVAELDLSSGDEVSPFFVKGSATKENSTVESPQGALFDKSDAADNLAIWKGGDWSDLIMETTIRSMDNDTIGVAFNHGKDGHYLLTLDNQTNTRQLLRISGDEQVILAEENGGYTFNIAQDLVIAKSGGRITATLDGQALFGGVVIDQAPLKGGTVGLYSSGQKSSIFDDVVVRDVELTAHAGSDGIVIDWNGDGKEQVTLDGGASILTGKKVKALWSGDDIKEKGLVAETTISAGRNDVTLTLNKAVNDDVRLDLASGDRLIAADRFTDGDHDGWKVIDTTELGSAANWQVIGGALVETSGAYSRELTWSGANSADVWDRGWSPLGDGTYALHKGSFALWEGNAELTDYAIRTEITAPKGAVGLMLNYVDENNYYKLELDARIGLVTLVKVVDNYESNIARSAASFAPGDSFTLEARIVDGKITATMDGSQLFANPVEVHDIETGSAGVWSWGAAGASFDDIAIVDLTTDFVREIHGTRHSDLLIGTDADEMIFGGGGVLDTLRGGGGCDTFVFAEETDNGRSDRTVITDYQKGRDLIDLGGAEIEAQSKGIFGTTLWIGEDRDRVIITGGLDVDDLTFL